MTRRTGDIEKKIVASDLQEERDKCDFDNKAMQAWLYGGQWQFEKRKELFDLVGQHKELVNFIEFEDMTQDEQQENLWRRIKFIFENHGDRFFKNFDLWDYPYFNW